MNNSETVQAIRDKTTEIIRAFEGVTANDHAAERARSIRNAARTGKNCAKCGREFEPGEPVWRFCRSLGRTYFGGGGHRVAPHCKQCRSNWDSYHPARPCAGCLRDVHNEDTGKPLRQETYCSEACRLRSAPMLARWRRQAARGFRRTCIECGETFAPARSDARFCGVACKQRAYRERVTASKRDAGATPAGSQNGADR